MNETKNANGTIEIDVQKLLLAYLKKWWLILTVAVIGAIIAYGFTTLFVTPMYTASTTIYVNNSTKAEKSDYVSASDLNTSERLVSTYIQMITSDTVLERVIEETDVDYTPEQLRKLTTSSQVGDTEIFKIHVKHEDPQMAAKITNAIAYIAPTFITEFIEGSSTKIIDYAKAPEHPSSPNKSRNAIIGGLCGALVVIAIITLNVIFDVRVKDDTDLRDLSDLPVLGQIPLFDEVKAKGGYGYRIAQSYDTTGNNSNQ